MLPQKHANVLRMIAARLEGTGVFWVVTGSTAFALQGVPLVPNDIDIQSDRDGAYAIEACFERFIKERVRFSSAENIRSHFGSMEIDGLKVELMGDIQKRVDGVWEEPVDLMKYKVFVPFDGMQVPVLDLRYEMEAYRKMGRLEKAAILQHFLDSCSNLSK